MPDLVDATIRIKANTAGFQTQMNQAFGGLRKQISETKASFKALAVGAGIFAGAMTLAGKSAISAAVQMDSLMRGLAAVSGGADQAQAQLGKLREIAKLPGLGLKEAIEGATRLQAVGINAEMANRALMAFGNALARVGKGKAELDGVILALTQIVGKGKVSAEEINQIAERVPEVRKVMMEAFGTASTEAIGKMNVTAEQFIGTLTAGFEKLPRVTGGAQNAIENFNDALFEARVALGEALLPTFTAILGKLADTVNLFNNLSDTQQSIIAWSGAVAGGLAGIIAAVAGFSMALPGLIAGIKALGVALTFLVANPIGIAITAIVGTAGIVAALVIWRSEARRTEAAIKDLSAAQQSQNETVKQIALENTQKQLVELEDRIDAYNKKIAENTELLEKFKAAHGSVGKTIVKLFTGIDQKEVENALLLLQKNLDTTTERANKLRVAINQALSQKYPEPLGPIEPPKALFVPPTMQVPPAEAKPTIRPIMEPIQTRTPRPLFGWGAIREKTMEELAELSKAMEPTGAVLQGFERGLNSVRETFSGMISDIAGDIQKIWATAQKDWDKQVIYIEGKTDEISRLWEEMEIEKLRESGQWLAAEIKVNDIWLQDQIASIKKNVKTEKEANELISKITAIHAYRRTESLERAGEEAKRIVEDWKNFSEEEYSNATKLIGDECKSVVAIINDEFAGFFDAMRNTIPQIEMPWVAMSQAIKGNWENTFDALAKTLNSFIADADEEISNFELAWKGMTQAFVGDYQGLFNTLKQYVSQVIDYIRGINREVENIVTELGASIPQTLTDVISGGITEGLSAADIGEQVHDFLRKQVIEMAVAALVADVPLIRDAVAEWSRAIAEALQESSEAGVVISRKEAERIKQAEAAIAAGSRAVAGSVANLGEQIGLGKPPPGRMLRRGVPREQIGAEVTQPVGGGVQISAITGETRDILVDLLTPLKNLNILASLMEAMTRAIYEMRDAFLGKNLRAGGNNGNGEITIENVNINVAQAANAGDVELINRNLAIAVNREKRLLGRRA